jgi:hypothetical protein
LRKDTPKAKAMVTIGQPLLGDGVLRASTTTALKLRAERCERAVMTQATENKTSAVKRAGSQDNTSSARAAHLPAHSQRGLR